MAEPYPADLQAYIEDMVAMQQRTEAKIVPRTIRLVIDVDVDDEALEAYKELWWRLNETVPEMLLREAQAAWESTKLVRSARLL